MNETILEEEEARVVGGDRQQDYGDCIKSFERIAEFWTTYLGHPVTAKDVAAMMILMKISRSITSDKRDNIVDAAGYAECMGRIVGAK